MWRRSERCCTRQEILAIDEHAAIDRIVEALQQRQGRRLARARWPDDGDHLAGGDVEVDAVEDGRVGAVVVEAHAVELHAPFDAIDRDGVGGVDQLILRVEDGVDCRHREGRGLERLVHARQALHGAEEAADVE